MTANNKSFLWASLLTLGLYFSGLFVVFTPLPLIYYQLKNRDESFVRVVWPVFAVVLFVYGFGAEFFYHLYQQKPLFVWLFPVPMVDLMEFFNGSMVRLVGIVYFLVYASMSFLIARALKEPQQKAFKILFFAVLGLFLVSAVFGFLMAYPKADMILASYRSYMEMAFNQILQAQERAGLAKDQIALLKASMGDFIDHFLYMMPFIFLGTVTFLFVLNILIAKKFYTVFFKDLAQIKLTEFQAPFELVWVVIGLGTLMVADHFVVHSKSFFFILLNFLLCVLIGYFLQGVAVFIHFMNRKQMRPWVKFPLYLVLVWMFESTIMLLTVSGFFEIWLDTRKLNKPSKPVIHKA